MSIITIAGNILWYCGDYSLKFTHELTKLIQVMTPIIFGILDFMSKCVGGFYWLIYMLWRGNSDPTPKYSYPAINPSPLAIMPAPSPSRRIYSMPKKDISNDRFNLLRSNGIRSTTNNGVTNKLYKKY